MSDKPSWERKVPKTTEQGFNSKLNNRSWRSQNENQETPDSRILYLKDISLTSPEPQIVAKVEIEIQPLKKLETGDKCGFLTFDQITPKMEEMVNKVILECSELENNEKPRKVMEVMLEYVQYAFADKIKNETQETQNIAKSYSCNFSDLVEAGFGVCRHLSPLYVWLIQQVGLSAIVQNNGGGVEDMKNVLRNEKNGKKGDPLFKLTPVGGHAWRTCLGFSFFTE